MIRAASVTDAEQVAAIYNFYVENTVVTFEEVPVTAAQMAERIARLTPEYPWLVYEHGGIVAGYAYAGRWHERSAYRWSVETSVYLDRKQLRQGLGTRLYEALLGILRERQYHCACGGIALPNGASIALHEKFGFRKVAHYHSIGYKFDRWIDVGFWQLIL